MAALEGPRTALTEMADQFTSDAACWLTPAPRLPGLSSKTPPRAPSHAFPYQGSLRLDSIDLLHRCSSREGLP